MQLKNKIILTIICIAASNSLADSYQITSNTFTQSATSSGGSFSVTGTIAPAASGTSTDSNYYINSGYIPANIGCKVNMTDIIILAEAWLTNDLSADINHSGLVDIHDFASIASWWYLTCPIDWPIK